LSAIYSSDGSCNFEKEQAIVEFEKGKVSIALLLNSINDAGYKASLVNKLQPTDTI